MWDLSCFDPKLLRPRVQRGPSLFDEKKNIFELMRKFKILFNWNSNLRWNLADTRSRDLEHRNVTSVFLTRKKSRVSYIAQSLSSCKFTDTMKIDCTFSCFWALCCFPLSPLFLIAYNLHAYKISIWWGNFQQTQLQIWGNPKGKPFERTNAIKFIFCFGHNEDKIIFWIFLRTSHF